MAQSRPRKRQSHQERVASYLRRHPGASRAAARGHGEHLRAPGVSEAADRRRKARERVAGGTPGRDLLTDTEKAAIRAAYVARARDFARRASEFGYPELRVSPVETVRMANADINRPGGWKTMTYNQFRAVWDTMTTENTAQLFFAYGEPNAADPVGTVQANFISDMNAAHGLHLADDMLWLRLLLYGKRGKKAA